MKRYSIAVETLFLQTLYVLVFIEIGSRRVHFAGYTGHPDNAWITQQARQVMWGLEDRDPAIRFLIRDNDKKFSQAFDTVFRAEGIDIIRTPYRAPKANAYAERVRREAVWITVQEVLRQTFNEPAVPSAVL